MSVNIRFASLYVNLELSGSEEFVAYGTMVKISIILKSPQHLITISF